MKLLSRGRILCASLVLSVIHPVFGLESVTVGDLKIQPGLEIGAGALAYKGQSFGSETSSYGVPADVDGSRFEGYLKPSLSFEYPTGGTGVLFGKTSVVSGITRGDSDGGGFTNGNTADTDWDDASLGWRASDLIAGQEKSSVSFSAGRQRFVIGNGFLIGSGHFSQGQEGLYWIAPRKAFDWTAIASADLNDFHADIFELRKRPDMEVFSLKETLTVRGANLEWNNKEYGKFGFTALKVSDDVNTRRDGMRVENARVTVYPTKAITLTGEYVWERGKGDDDNSSGYYVEGTYSFNDVPWTPALTYRYAKFGENYDALLYGFMGDWGYWFQGEIVGEGMLFNTNEVVNMVKLAAFPTPSTRVGIMAYDFDYAKAPPGITDKDFAKEVNVFFDWYPNANLSFGVLAGYARPDGGAKQLFGTSENSKLVEIYTIYKF